MQFGQTDAMRQQAYGGPKVNSGGGGNHLLLYLLIAAAIAGASRPSRYDGGAQAKARCGAGSRARSPTHGRPASR